LKCFRRKKSWIDPLLPVELHATNGSKAAIPEVMIGTA
jgi:hypothetical protein